MNNPRSLVHRITLAGAALALAVGAVPAASASAASINPDTIAPTITYVPCPHGVHTAVITHAKGFNPLTATKAELLANYLPPRPSDASKLALWERFVTTAKSQTSCGEMKSTGLKHSEGPHSKLKPASSADTGAVGATGEQDSANWAGNVATGTYWNDAYGTFTIQVPQAPASSCAYSSQWVGIGQGNSSTYPLVQAGSADNACDDRSSSSIYLWWEVVYKSGGLPEQEVVSASAGNTISVYIHVPNNCGEPTMELDNWNTGFYHVYTYSGAACSDGTAEWIFERPEINFNPATGAGTFPLLANAAVDFSDAEVAGPGISTTGVGNVQHYYSNMFNCTSAPNAELAYPGAISSNGESFTNYWKAYGTASNAKGCSAW